MRISVVCAAQTFGCNAGMYSVDLAAWYFLRKRFPDAHVTYLTLYPHRCDFGRGPVLYSPEPGDPRALRDSDLILYWGDFLHALHYRNAVVVQLLEQGICASADMALMRAREFLFLAESASDMLGKAVLYGGTLLFDPPDSNLDELYAEDLRQLLRSARGVWMRDPLSAFTVIQLQRYARLCPHGTDCAQLLRRETLEYLAVKSGSFGERVGKTGRLGVFIGRSHLDANHVSAFIGAISTEMHLEMSWLHWGDAPFFLERKNDILSRIPQVERGTTDCSTGSTPIKGLTALLGFDLVISDTYHVCVNAWNLGIPAICVIDDSDLALPVNSGSQASRRDKRTLFYWTYNAASFLVYASELESEIAVRETVTRLCAVLDDGTLAAEIATQMRQHAQRSEESLAYALGG